MKQIKIEGGHELTGEIKISGAKNSAVALVPASLLSDGVVTIDNIPNISDIDALNEILEYLGAMVSRGGETMKIDSSTIVMLRCIFRVDVRLVQDRSIKL